MDNFTFSSPPDSFIYPDLEDFLVSEKELQQVRQSFVTPKSYDDALSSLLRWDQLWLLGSPGVGKRTLALVLANELRERYSESGVYLIPRTMRWSQLSKIVQKAGNAQAEYQADAGIEPHLKQRLVEILIRQEQFTSDTNLRSIFVDERIKRWQPLIPEADSLNNRVSQVISFLLTQNNVHGNGLVLFLQVVVESIDEGLEVSEELAIIAAELESMIISSDSPKESVKMQNIFIFPDTLGTIRLEHENLDSELRYLKRLKEEHFLILTSSLKVFDEADRETPLRSEIKARFELTADLYDQSQKIAIFEKCLQLALDTAKISRRQHGWAVDKLLRAGKRSSAQVDEDFSRRLANWLPIDIYRYVFASLPDSQVANDVYHLLQQNADFDSRIKAWFSNLDESTKAFIFTLVLFAGQPTRMIWESHKEIVSHFRQFDHSLAVLPLGILRQRAAPYVTENGIIDFINPRVYQTIMQEVALNYREYFIDCLDLFQAISLHEMTDGGHGLEGVGVRNEFALFTGEVAKHDLNDVKPILQSWGSQSQMQVIKSVGIVLEHTATDSRSMQAIYEMLDDWLARRGSDEADINLRRAVGAVIWRITTASSAHVYISWTLRLIGRMASDRQPRVASSAAYALLMMSDFLPLQRMRSTLTNLASRKTIQYKYVAWTINRSAASVQNKSDIILLLEYWLLLENPQRHSTAYYALLIGMNLPDAARERLLQQALVDEGRCLTLTSTLFQTLREKMDRDKRNANEAQRIFTQAVDGLQSNSERTIVAVMLDDLQKREHDSNSNRNAEDIDWTCRNILQDWLVSTQRNVCWTAISTLWIGEHISLEDCAKWLTKTAQNTSEFFVETLIDVIKLGHYAQRIRTVLQFLKQNSTEKVYIVQLLEGSPEIATAISSLQLTNQALLSIHSEESDLLHLLHVYPVQFLEALDQGLASGAANIVWDNLTALAENHVNFAIDLSGALQSGYRDCPLVSCRVSDAFINMEHLPWAWIITHALLGSDELLESEKYPRLEQIVYNQPGTFVQVIDWYAQNNTNQAAFQESVLEMCLLGSESRSLVIEACVTALRTQQISRGRLKNDLKKIPDLDSQKLMSDVNTRLIWAETRGDGNFSFLRIVSTVIDIFRGWVDL